MNKTAWTDYPFAELGDTAGKRAPIRECKVLSYDGDKYCNIEINGLMFQVKRCYLYRAPGRCGEVRTISMNRVRIGTAPKIVYVANAEEAFDYLKAIDQMPDSEINYSDIPKTDDAPERLQNATVGKFYRAINKEKP